MAMNVQRNTDRISRVQAPVIPIVGSWISEHPNTISLGQGMVHYAAPAQVFRAISTAVSDDPRVDKYGLVRGNADLLNTIQLKLANDNQICIDDRQCIIFTSGSNMGFVNTVLAIGDVEDEIILLSPYYFNHEMAIELAGCRPVVVATNSNYQIDLDRLESAITSRTRAIVTVSPNNPTGAVYPREALIAVNEMCRLHNVYHVSDEAYEYFIYGDDDHFSPASLSDVADHTISLFSLSKAYGMAGWRCAYQVVPAHLETAINKIQDTNLVCPPIISQIAAQAALQVGSEWCREKIAGFRQVRDLVLDELSTLGDRCRVPKPDGAFYALLQLSTDESDMALVEQLIRDYGVAVMPGSAFGDTSRCSLRVAFGALQPNAVAEGVGRLVSGLRKLI